MSQTVGRKERQYYSPATLTRTGLQQVNRTGYPVHDPQAKTGLTCLFTSLTMIHASHHLLPSLILLSQD